MNLGFMILCSCRRIHCKHQVHLITVTYLLIDFHWPLLASRPGGDSQRQMKIRGLFALSASSRRNLKLFIGRASVDYRLPYLRNCVLRIFTLYYEIFFFSTPSLDIPHYGIIIIFNWEFRYWIINLIVHLIFQFISKLSSIQFFYAASPSEYGNNSLHASSLKFPVNQQVLRLMRGECCRI